jgi:hypothetical protein
VPPSVEHFHRTDIVLFTQHMPTQGELAAMAKQLAMEAERQGPNPVYARASAWQGDFERLDYRWRP